MPGDATETASNVFNEYAHDTGKREGKPTNGLVRYVLSACGLGCWWEAVADYFVVAKRGDFTLIAEHENNFHRVTGQKAAQLIKEPPQAIRHLQSKIIVIFYQARLETSQPMQYECNLVDTEKSLSIRQSLSTVFCALVAVLPSTDAECFHRNIVSSFPLSLLTLTAKYRPQRPVLVRSGPSATF
ncbi:uncharacterized protein BBA_10333 [Beauveria bassiana ARSEF 2860]|uniref:Uncharacterized protein n=1 Tax=Beauveria bassiana (strain ARSEF 2860) TaxID=655819 RepID=J4VPS3_BEAB2|nr:uncharacterized protein BBA_10333 [Beauveria bassiana ARSEF 2860]EJP60720.1 hypothetical protein BBA_10333 [Beauveria bassiana ARSEF 2860]